jgi:hypothetical protein
MARADHHLSDQRGSRIRAPARARRAAKTLREQGARSFALKLLSWARIYRRLLLCAIYAPPTEMKADIPVEVSLLEEGEVDEYLAADSEADPATVQRRLGEGQRCFVGRWDGRIVGSAWTALGHVWIDYLQYDLPLEPDEFFVYDIRTFPEFRGHNVSHTVGAWLGKYMTDLGFIRRGLALFFSENIPSLEMISAAGFEPVALVGYLRLGPIRRDFRRPMTVTASPGGTAS